MNTDGELFYHRATDAMFTIPNFVDENLVQRCGEELLPVNEHEMQARLKILKKAFNITIFSLLEGWQANTQKAKILEKDMIIQGFCKVHYMMEVFIGRLQEVEVQGMSW